jgi:RNA polymerase sigma factor (sigma-70 family)
MPLADEGQHSDAQLLERFLSARDEAAFAALVRRHGPMVLGVCRRVLQDYHDAEDAFQAAFLVLARKAASVRHEALGSWLYTVAYHAALAARAARARRHARERQVEEMPHPEVPPPEAQDWRPLLDRELHKLPEKYRAALVVCDLQGKTRKEAAQELGLAEGTVSSRLATARGMLARRLSRRGLSLSGAALAVGLAPRTTAAVPGALVNSTVQAAALVAAGQMAAVATPAAGLMKGVLKAMLLTKLKLVIATAMITAVLGAGGLVYRSAGQAAPAAEEEKSLSDVETLRKENELLRLNVQVLLEKVRSLEAEVLALKGQPGGGATPNVDKTDQARSQVLKEQIHVLQEEVRALEAEALARRGRPAEGAKPNADKTDQVPRAVAANLTRSQNNLKQLGLAFHNYNDSFGSLPPSAISDRQGKPLLSWRVAILPFIEQDALYKEFHLDEPWDSEHNKKLLERMPDLYKLPGIRNKPGMTAYQVFVGKDALFFGTRKSRIPASIPDGTSNTVLVAEAAEMVPWTKPADIPFGDEDPRGQVGGWYGDLVNVGICDGSARTVNRKKVTKETFRNAINPADGNVLGSDW